MGEWTGSKRRLVESIWEDRITGYLDPGAEEYLWKLNSPPNLATVSSCIGRVTVVEGEWHWDRGSSRIVFKSHGEVKPEDLYRVLSRPFENLWLKVSGPIIHFRTPSLECAMHVIHLARASGFKHSGIISRKPEGVTLEAMSGVQITSPLRIGGVDIYGARGIRALVEISNHALKEGKRRIAKLSNSIHENPGPCA